MSGFNCRAPQACAILLKIICGCVLAGILVAGLWPFHAPTNEVSWLSNNEGLFFGKHGSIVSASQLKANGLQSDTSCSLEIWLQPSRVDSLGKGTILAFYRPESRFIPFSMRQFRDGLVLYSGSQGPMGKAEVYVGEVFNDIRPTFVTISSGKSGTTVYVDGVLARDFTNFTVSSRDLTGQLVIGNHPSTSYSWSGKLRGLAVYDRDLRANEVSQDFIDWTAGRPTDHRSDSVISEGVVARYPFDEGKGNIVHDRVDSAPNLAIPERFFVLNEQFLERPWDEYRADWSYWKDAGINIGGFIPLGFVFSAYFSMLKKFTPATWLTIALGFVISLTIEVLQALLPTRDSGMTDLLTNTLGTALGALLWAWSVKHVWIVQACLLKER